MGHVVLYCIAMVWKTSDLGLIGKTFNKLTILEPTESHGGKQYFWCRCECGVELEICGTLVKKRQEEVMQCLPETNRYKDN